MKRKLLIAGAVVLPLFGMLILAVSWWQYPGHVVKASLGKLGAAKTQQFDASLVINNTEASQNLVGQQAQVQLLLGGEFERRQDERDSLAADVRLITETEGLTVNIEAATRFIGDKAYLQITKSPPSLPVLIQLKNQWLELPRGDAATAETAKPTGPLFINVQRIGRDEKIDGQTVTAYTADATAGAIVRLLDNMADILGTRLTAEQIDNVRRGITGIETVPVQLWITPFSHELVKLSSTLTVPGSNTITFELKPTDRNKLVEITVPEGAVTLEGAIAGLQQAGSSSAEQGQ
jgi:hypothetical protein